jgi:hypothetical protein
MAFQAIQTKYHGPTNTRGARISAVCAGGKCSIPYPYELSGTEVHYKAAQTLCAKLNWNPDTLVGGCLHDGTYAFVFNDYPGKA